MIAKSIPAAVLNNSADRFCVLPTLMVPTLSVPGFAFAAAMKSVSVLKRRGAAGGEDEIEIAEARDRREILQRIERQLPEQRDADGRAVREQRQRGAVRRRGDHRARRGDSAGAGLVLDIKTLAEPVAELFRDDARGDVGHAARRKRQHDPHRPVRVFGLRDGGGEQRCNRKRNDEKASGDKWHKNSLWQHEVGWSHCLRLLYPPLEGASRAG
jgi:hypothetical protein